MPASPWIGSTRKPATWGPWVERAERRAGMEL